MARPDDDFPWKQTCVLAICRLAEPVAFCSITAYAFIMVQDIKGERDASFYSGLLVSAFALAEACTAFVWGSLSDRYGRKPIILVALAGTAVSSLIFGFAKNYWLALVARVIGGALNGNVAVMQTMVAEMVHKPEHEPRAYALQPFMWAVGSMAGSALGGFTAQPARYYPNLFSQDGIFGQFPYLLPNLISVVVILLAMLQGYLFLQETNPALIAKQKSGSTSEQPVTSEVQETTPLLTERRESVASKSTTRSHSIPYIAVSAPLPTDPSFDLRRSSTASISSLALFQKSLPPPEPHHASALADENATHELTAPSTVFTKSVILWIISLWLLCYHQMAFGSLLPVYLLDEPRGSTQRLDLVGGLGKDLPHVGTMLAVNSVISLVVQGAIFPAYVAKVGVWWSTVSLIALCPLGFVVAPFVSALANPDPGMYAVMTLQCLSSNMAYPVILIMLKNACPSPLVLGRVNGLAMSGCSGARTLAPPVVGAVYSAVGAAGAWWSAGVVALFASVELLFISRPKESSDEIVRRASVSAEVA